MTDEVDPQELVDGGQCKHCRAWQKTLAEPLVVDKRALDAITSSLLVPVLLDIELFGTNEESSQQQQLERVAKKLDGRGVIARLDASEHRETAWDLGVSAVPTMLLFKKRHVIFQWEGAADASLVEEWLRMAFRM